MNPGDILEYTDGFGLVAPHPVEPGAMRSCDNGTLYLSEWIITLSKNGIKPDRGAYEWVIARCLNSKGNLCRAPGDEGQDGPDNHLGVAAGCKALGIESIPRRMLYGMFSNWGFSNNEIPGTIRKKDGSINWEAFLIRQPQLVCSLVSASGLAWVPLFWPLYIYTALVIATSCVGVKTSNQDARMLSFLLINSVCPDSFLCKLAAKIWRNRLYFDYGPEGMTSVARLCFQGPHPIATYMPNGLEKRFSK